MSSKSKRTVTSARRRASAALGGERVELPKSSRGAVTVEGLTLHTIGYEGTNIIQFLAALHAHDIATVIDVRELPLSRKSGFSKNALAVHLARSGFQYVHIPALGCPRVIRHRYRSDGDWVRYERAFIEHLDMQQDALASLAEIASNSKSALLCFEASAAFCHRRIVARAAARMTHSPVLHLSIGNARGANARAGGNQI